MKAICNGLLPIEVYSAMYEVAKRAPEKFFVEVGTAHAAGTVSLAMGLRDSGRVGKVFTFEKITGGSREAFGGIDKNKGIIKKNLKAFGVDDLVHLEIGDVAETAAAVPNDKPLGLLCLDADGAIDRDFSLFFDRLSEGAPIIIDDSRDMTRIKRLGRIGLSHRLKVDQKHRLTFHLINIFLHHKLITEGVMHGEDTYICRKGSGAFADLPSEMIMDAYRSLIFTEATLSYVPFRGVLAKILRSMLPKPIIERLRSFERGDLIK